MAYFDLGKLNLAYANIL